MIVIVWAEQLLWVSNGHKNIEDVLNNYCVVVGAVLCEVVVDNCGADANPAMLVAGTQGGSQILNQTGRSGTALCGIQNMFPILNPVSSSLGLPDGSIENHAARKQNNWGLQPAAVGRWLDRSYFPPERPPRLKIAMCLRAYMYICFCVNGFYI